MRRRRHFSLAVNMRTIVCVTSLCVGNSSDPARFLAAAEAADLNAPAAEGNEVPANRDLVVVSEPAGVLEVRPGRTVELYWNSTHFITSSYDSSGGRERVIDAFSFAATGSISPEASCDLEMHRSVNDYKRRDFNTVGFVCGDSGVYFLKHANDKNANGEFDSVLMHWGFTKEKPKVVAKLSLADVNRYTRIVPAPGGDFALICSPKSSDHGTRPLLVELKKKRSVPLGSEIFGLYTSVFLPSDKKFAVFNTRWLPKEGDASRLFFRDVEGKDSESILDVGKGELVGVTDEEVTILGKYGPEHVLLVDVESGEKTSVALGPLDGDPDARTGVAISADGHRVACGDGFRVVVYDSRSGTPMAVVDKNAGKPVDKFGPPKNNEQFEKYVLSGDGSTLLTLCRLPTRGARLELWRLSNAN